MRRMFGQQERHMGWRRQHEAADRRQVLEGASRQIQEMRDDKMRHVGWDGGVRAEVSANTLRISARFGRRTEA